MDKESRNQALNFKDNAHAFPLAGLIIALPACAVLTLAWVLDLPFTLAAILTLFATVLCTGALHEDGLADVADGFWGGSTKERKLNIMRDSAIGTYGVIALIFVLGTKILTLAALIAKISLVDCVLILLAVTSLSRAAMIVPWVLLSASRPANAKKQKEGIKSDAGLSARYGEPDIGTMLWTALMAIPAFVMMMVAVGFMPALIGVLLSGLGVCTVLILAKNHIGGHTGDVLGTSQQMSEIGLYFGLLIAI